MKAYVVVSGATVLADADTQTEAFGLQTFLQRHDPNPVSVRPSRPDDFFVEEIIDLRESVQEPS